MNILVVGNILKDVYLSIDGRTEDLESDQSGVKWLNLAFDAGSHHFFHRASTYGGAAISLEVFTKLGLSASVNGYPEFGFDAPHPHHIDGYRYILTSDEAVSYLVQSTRENTTFSTPDTLPDYLYIDRSASLTVEEVEKITIFLDQNPTVRLILYYKSTTLDPLLSYASLIVSEKSYNFPPVFAPKTIILSENAISFGQTTEPITVVRVDKITHLSLYSMAAATVIGGFILGRSVETSLKLARVNVENANLDATLNLFELEKLAAEPDESLELITASLMAPDKGILAADESGGSIAKKFAEHNLPDTFENRHNYRNIFFTTPDIEHYLSGIILFDETARDFMDSGESIPDFLISRRIIPGIKVDEGLTTFAKLGDAATASFSLAPAHPEEPVTKGLETLPRRLRAYHDSGLRFAKWRAAFPITLDEAGAVVTPTEHAIYENCRRLAEYAKACQGAGLVPIVEPEVIYDGDYSIDVSAAVTSQVLTQLIQELNSFSVNLRACIVKCNFVLAGKRHETRSTPAEVGAKTAEVLRNSLPDHLGGVVFLSGGQTPDQAVQNLAAVIKNGPFPWPVSFSFARALQDPVLSAWNGQEGNAEKARAAFLRQLKACQKAL